MLAHKISESSAAAAPAAANQRKVQKSGTRAAAPNPTSLAPGARMTVVKHTRSNYYHLIRGIIHITDMISITNIKFGGHCSLLLGGEYVH